MKSRGFNLLASVNKRSILLLCGFVFGVFLIINQTSAIFYEISWDTTKTPPGLPLGTELSLFASPWYGPLFVGATNGRLYISSDNGVNWTETQPAGDVDKNWSALSISGNGEILIAAVANGRIYRSINSGVDWAEIQPAGNVDKNWSSVVLNEDGDVIIATVFGGRLYVSNDTGENWAEAPAPLNADMDWSALTTSASGSTMIAGAENGRLYLSSDLGNNWDEVQPAGDNNFDWNTVSCDFTGLVCLAGINGGRLYYSSLFGADWAEIQPAGAVNKNWSATALGAEGEYLFAAANSGRIYYSTNLGSTWNESKPEGDIDQTWSSIIVNSAGDFVWAANQSNVIYKGSISQAIPAQPGNFTHTSNTTAVKTYSDYPLFRVNEIQNSGTSIFGQAHGNVQVGNKFYIGTRTNPAKIVVFNNPDDLSDYDSVTIPGIVGLESMTYDSIAHRIYSVGATSLSGDTENLKIYSINPDDISDYTQVVNEVALPDQGSSAIVNDGAFVYGVTYDNPPKFFKYRISDWSLVASNTWTGGPSLGHAATLHIYNNRTELYFSAALGTSALAKVDASDLSYQEYNFGVAISISDDIYFRYLDETGGILYVGSEGNSGIQALDTRSMTVTAVSSPPTYGIFSDGNDLYSMGKDGYITRYLDFDLDSPRIYRVSGEIPNEFFYTSSGQKYFTNWSNPGYIKEFEETSTLVVDSTVELTWTEEMPEAIFDIYTSTNGVVYNLVGSGNSPYMITGLTPGTQYWFKVVAKNGILSSDPAIYSLTTPVFTAAALPTVPSITTSSRTKTSITMNWSGNNSSYLAKLENNSSGWTTATQHTFTGLTCGQEYIIKVKSKNNNGVESNYQAVSLSTDSCTSGSGIPQSGGFSGNIDEVFDFIINSGEAETTNRELLITMKADPKIVRHFAISLDKDFTQSDLISYVPSIKFSLPDITGFYTVYVKFYSAFGQGSKVVSKQIWYNRSGQINKVPSVREVPLALEKNIAKTNFFTRNLMFGMKGNDVRDLQNFLNINGFIVAKTGAGSTGNETRYFGRLTREAVRGFQKAKKIVPAWGNFGPITRGLINKIVADQ